MVSCKSDQYGSVRLQLQKDGEKGKYEAEKKYIIALLDYISVLTI